jgi:hypothetical protein
MSISFGLVFGFYERSDLNDVRISDTKICANAGWMTMGRVKAEATMMATKQHFILLQASNATAARAGRLRGGATGGRV